MDSSKKPAIKRVPLWRIYRESGDVFKHLSFYTPNDVEKTNDVELLKKMYVVYSMNDLAWDDYNWKTMYYTRVMSLRVLKKLTGMGLYPPYDVNFTLTGCNGFLED